MNVWEAQEQLNQLCDRLVWIGAAVLAAFTIGAVIMIATEIRRAGR